MEALSTILQPYKDLVGNIAAIVTVGQMFSGSFLCWDAYKQGNTRGIPISPFLGGIIMSVVNLKYGMILRDDTMIQVNLFGLALNIVYIMIFFNYSQEKFKVWGQIGFAGAVSAVLIGYAQYEDPKLVENRLGLIITAFMFYLIASPLFGLNDIIKNKSTEGMPFPIILSGSVVTFMWLLYGIIIKNQFVIVQNLVGLFLCSIQLSLFVIYPSKSKDAKVKSKAKKTD
ncbi:sugar transporter SWEET1 [Plodia interpunctella]|uniref:sugar transporter SWEET1 n=1 Tax=Plodia interpunctella TaxID=58824 RepID=UPI0023687E6A|nr:sugar transporter SWEET1 [Plodia interpunctella]XP_053625544.1 sugar transporter SWEET1 [Plodia interpunctella]